MNETDRDKAYILIDMFLRNRLDDEAYSEYSAALELCFTDESLIKQLSDSQKQVTLLRDELFRVKGICLREVGLGIVNEVVLAATVPTSTPTDI